MDSLEKFNLIFLCALFEFNFMIYNRGQNICGKCSISAKKPTPQANENHCLRPFVEKQVFRTCVFRTCVFRTCVFRTCVFRTCVFRTCVFRTCVFRTCVFRLVLRLRILGLMVEWSGEQPSTQFPSGTSVFRMC